MRKFIIAAVVTVGLSMPVGSALAFGGPNPNPNAVANCFENIAKQNANGQTGDANGNANDSKQGATAVTNCDHFWN